MPKKSGLTFVAVYTPRDQQTDEDRRCLARGLAIARGIELRGDLVREPLPVPISSRLGDFPTNTKENEVSPCPNK